MENCCRILIVDDEFITRQGIRYMMNWEEQGYRVVGEASNGKEALDLIEELNPHIVLCDIAMPVMDGLDLIQILYIKYPDIQVIMLSGYDNFEYVGHALRNGAADYVLKPTLNPVELLKILSRAAQNIPNLQLEQKVFSSLETRLEQYLCGASEVINSREFHEHFPHSCYRLVGIPMGIRDLKGQDMSQIIYEKAELYLEQHNEYRSLKFLFRQEFLCVVFNYPLRDSGRFLEFLEDMTGKLAVIHDKAFAVAGRECRNFADLKTEFSNPAFIEAELFYHKGIHLCQAMDQEDSVSMVQKFNFRKFSSAMAEGRYAEGVGLFQAYVCKALQCRMPEYKLKNQTKNLLYNIIGSVEGKVQKLEDIRCEYFRKIDEASYAQDFEAIFGHLVQELTTCLESGDDGQDIRLQNMLDYIAEHFNDELDLTGLSRVFNFNYSYLSAYFNSRMGEGFSEYLNRIRIGRACKMLEEGEYSIASVSSMVGYSDQSYFCRVFKKITGETPSVYRRGHMKRSI